MRKRCGDCKRSLKGLRWVPMVHSHIWRAVSDPGRFLCDGCFRQRMRRMLGRTLRLEDLRVCQFNLDDGHHKELTLPGKQRLDFQAAALNLPANNKATRTWLVYGHRLGRDPMCTSKSVMLVDETPCAVLQECNPFVIAQEIAGLGYHFSECHKVIAPVPDECKRVLFGEDELFECVPQLASAYAYDWPQERAAKRPPPSRTAGPPDADLIEWFSAASEENDERHRAGRMPGTTPRKPIMDDREKPRSVQGHMVAGVCVPIRHGGYGDYDELLREALRIAPRIENEGEAIRDFKGRINPADGCLHREPGGPRAECNLPDAHPRRQYHRRDSAGGAEAAAAAAEAIQLARQTEEEASR